MSTKNHKGTTLAFYETTHNYCWSFWQFLKEHKIDVFRSKGNKQKQQAVLTLLFNGLALNLGNFASISSSRSAELLTLRKRMPGRNKVNLLRMYYKSMLQNAEPKELT